MYALIDCNNFFVSCERVFRPELKKKPVVVLSNNDGCFISRSDEVKQLGVPMGAPYFQWKEQVERMNAAVFSANFSLYGNMSNRVMQVLSQFSPRIEVYSIDEAFIDLRSIRTENLTAYVEGIGQTIYRWTGIPVSIGIGSTKSLAKLANKYVKDHKYQYPKRVFNIEEVVDMDAVLHRIPVGDVWGVGRAYQRLLESEGVKTVYQLKSMSDLWIERQMTVVGLRIVRELRGTSCLPLEEVRPMKKGIVSSRSFGRPVTSLQEMREAVATYAARAAEKLRQEQAIAGIVTVSLGTSRFQTDTYYKNYAVMPLSQPSNYTPDISKNAVRGLEQIFRTGYRYKKAAVMLTGIVPQTRKQLHLFSDNQKQNEQERLMRLVDVLNQRHGRRALRFAAEGKTGSPLWTGKRELQSPCYTTRWEQLARVQ
ncbi:MAG: Y-family DNA polymerase [Patescibacteria group bacterium]